MVTLHVLTLSWVICRCTRILVLVLELHHHSIRIHIVLIWVFILTNTPCISICRWKDNTIMGLKEICCGNVNWIHLSQYWVLWWFFVNMINLQVTLKERNTVNGWPIISFSKLPFQGISQLYVNKHTIYRHLDRMNSDNLVK
jgi:hypothetical protein